MPRFGSQLRVRRIDEFGRISIWGNEGDKAVIVSNNAMFPYAFVATERGAIGIIRLHKKLWRKQITHFSNSSMKYVEEVINSFFKKKELYIKFKLLRYPISEKDILCYEVRACGE